MPAPCVSIIVPTLNEAQNLAELTRRIDAAMAGRSYEIILVDDDSADDTPCVGAELALRFPLRLIVRKGAADGLAGAVIKGLGEANGRFLVVMDADLQHPPESLPDLLRVLEEDQADFAVGSRYVEGGTTEDEWGLARRINSRAATLLARPLAGKLGDPMSGFFALTRATWERARDLSPTGYKIALELICKCGVERVVEVPIHFARRARGESKLCLREQCRYLDHLCKLYDFAFPRLSPRAKVLAATALGWLAGLAVLLAVALARMGWAEGVIVSYGGAIAASAVFHHRMLRVRRPDGPHAMGWLGFGLLAAIEWVTCAVVAVGAEAHAGRMVGGMIFVASFAVATLMRFILRRDLRSMLGSADWARAGG